MLSSFFVSMHRIRVLEVMASEHLALGRVPQFSEWPAEEIWSLLSRLWQAKITEEHPMTTSGCEYGCV